MAGKPTTSDRGVEQWREAVKAASTRPVSFDTISGDPVQPLYTPRDLPGFDYQEQLGYPGQHPFTRGVHANLYRGRLWTMRQFAGFGTPRQTNERFRFLLDKGQTGLSVAFDLPTLMGLDSDHPRAAGEVGKLGVAVDSIQDMEQLLAGIDLGGVSTSMTINAPAAIIMAFYLVAAERQGVPWDRLRGTLQNDILKEFHAQNEFVFPPEPSVRLVVDVIEFCAARVPLWNPVSISGYHIREAGSTAAQELAFTLADGMEYVRWTIRRGLGVDDFAPRFSFFFNAHNDFFEEVAKYRAARRIWARQMRELFGAADASCRLRFHAQTAGCSLQAQQPEVNLIRVACQAMAAVLGGCQSLHTNSMDETLALPTEHAVTLALRTQQVLAHETGLINTVDPLGGSYFVESLTNRLEEEAMDYFRRIDELGGVIAGINSGFFRRQIAEASMRYQREVEEKKRIIVGVNEFTEPPPEEPLQTHRFDPRAEAEQVEGLRRFKAACDAGKVRACLDRVRQDAAGAANLVPALIDAARQGATVGQIMDALAGVFGRFRGGAGWW